MKYRLHYTGEFKRSLKRCLKRGYDEQLLTDVLNILAADIPVQMKSNTSVNNTLFLI
jgi:mRNA-degrading endonuclease YafQ of YafQ-DinJ toxin-antitoxin module